MLTQKLTHLNLISKPFNLAASHHYCITDTLQLYHYYNNYKTLHPRVSQVKAPSIHLLPLFVFLSMMQVSTHRLLYWYEKEGIVNNELVKLVYNQ